MIICYDIKEAVFVVFHIDKSNVMLYVCVQIYHTNNIYYDDRNTDDKC